MHIAVAGNIGSGKTTLTKMLAAHYNWVPKFESVDFNPVVQSPDIFPEQEVQGCGGDIQKQGCDNPGQDNL